MMLTVKLFPKRHRPKDLKAKIQRPWLHATFLRFASDSVIFLRHCALY